MRSAAPLAALLLLALADAALGAPGGGSSGFGGGGGGGGGGFSGGGGSGGSGGGGGLLFVILAGAFLLLFLAGAVARWRYRRRRRERVRQVELASAVAADDDAHFAAGDVRSEAAELQRHLVAAWTARDRDALRSHLGPDLMVEWERRLDDFDRKGWHNVSELKQAANVEYVGLVNREDDTEDRVVVRLECQVRDVVLDAHGNVIKRSEEAGEVVTLAEYWTLGRREDRWILLSIEQDSEGRHHLTAPLVTAPWADDSRLHDEAVTELAAADAVPTAQIPELADVDFDGDARAAALDLSNVDGRFAPQVLEAAARRAVEAWAEAVDGDDAGLEEIATPEAVQRLLHPGDASRETRLVVRGPRLTQLRIAALDAGAKPPTMTVEADVSGRRYVEDRDTAAVLDGSKAHETNFTERWTLALHGDDATPWRIVAA